MFNLEIEDVSHFSLDGFYTFRKKGGRTFRPCCTSIYREDALNGVLFEANEMHHIENMKFPEVLCLARMNSSNVMLPIHLHPFLWNRRIQSDVDWYNQVDIPFIPFVNFRTNERKYIPRDLSVINNRSENEGLSWLPYEGYAFDTNLELAKIRSVMELIEKDVVTIWWHRETASNKISIEEHFDLLKIDSILKNQGVDWTILEITNDLGVYVVVSILELDDYPKCVYGSAAHINVVDAVKHSVFEAISCIAGLRYDFVHYKFKHDDLPFPNFLRNESTAKISQYKAKKSLDIAINKYNFYYSYIEVDNGYLVKSYCYEMQPTLYKDTVPLTKRLFLASEKQLSLKDIFPFQ